MLFRCLERFPYFTFDQCNEERHAASLTGFVLPCIAYSVLAANKPKLLIPNNHVDGDVSGIFVQYYKPCKCALSATILHAVDPRHEDIGDKCATDTMFEMSFTKSEGRLGTETPQLHIFPDDRFPWNEYAYVIIICKILIMIFRSQTHDQLECPSLLLRNVLQRLIDRRCERTPGLYFKALDVNLLRQRAYDRFTLTSNLPVFITEKNPDKQTLLLAIATASQTPFRLPWLVLHLLAAIEFWDKDNNSFTLQHGDLKHILLSAAVYMLSIMSLPANSAYALDIVEVSAAWTLALKVLLPNAPLICLNETVSEVICNKTENGIQVPRFLEQFVHPSPLRTRLLNWLGKQSDWQPYYKQLGYR
jgi:hypothetical protein